MSHIMEMMMSEIRYSKSTLPECCRRLGERAEEPFGSAFQEIADIMRSNRGESFSEVFSSQMDKCLKNVPIKRQEKELFLSFASESGFAEGKMQLLAIEQYQDRLKNIIEVAERELSEKSRMALGLGAMSGLFLVILFL
jgi:stage III sporulation protein AB